MKLEIFGREQRLNLGPLAPEASAEPLSYHAFLCLTQLIMNFNLLIKTKMLTNKDFSCFETLGPW